MSTAANRVWTFATVIIVIVIVALGWFLGVAPRLAEATRAETDRALVAAQNQATSIALEQLRQDAARLPQLESELLALQVEFPETPAYDAVSEELVLGLLDEGLALESLSFNEPTPVDPLVVADEFGQVPEGNLLKVDASLSVLGGLTETLDFVDRLQSSERLTLVTSFVFADEEDETRTNLVLTVFVISGPPAEGALPLGGTPVAEEEPADAEGDEGE